MDERLSSKAPPSWSLSDLKHPRRLLVAAVAMLGVGAITQVASCNVHELSHAVVATVLGWEVDQVFLCVPPDLGAGSVVYARTDTGLGHVQGYAGGFGAATFVIGVYWLALVRQQRPLRGPGWWAAGLSMLAVAGAQLFLGVLEGVAGPPGWDYSRMIDDHPAVWLPVLGASMLAGAAAHVWRWRAVWPSSLLVIGRRRT